MFKIVLEDNSIKIVKKLKPSYYRICTLELFEEVFTEFNGNREKIAIRLKIPKSQVNDIVIKMYQDKLHENIFPKLEFDIPEMNYVYYGFGGKLDDLIEYTNY